MAKHRRTIGSGITARTVVSYSGDDMLPAADAFAERWNAALAEANGSAFHAAVLDTERTCVRILEEAGPGWRRAAFEADSVEDFARRIVRAIEATKGHIARNDADAAARAALDVGRLVTEAHLKQVWEQHALRGEKNDSILKAVSGRANRKRQSEAAHRHAEWQAMAERIWARNEHLSATAVAKQIAGAIGGNWKTIRRKITHK